MDDNAPITYGTHETLQRAAVYADANSSAAKSTGSIIETSYRNPSGVIENVRVAVSTLEGKTDQDRWQLLIEQTPNVTVALSTPKPLSFEQYSSLAAQLKIDEIKFSSKALADLYSENEIDSRLFQSYMVFKARPNKGIAVVSAPALRKVSSDLMLLDGEARPFFATRVRLLAPDNTVK